MQLPLPSPTGNGGWDGINGKAPHRERESSMLVLSRKLGEKIIIGNNIVVTVVKIDRNQIRIGIEAPHDVPVFREEILPTTSSKGEPEGSMAR
jgi:carbon storage regulator